MKNDWVKEGSTIVDKLNSRKEGIQKIISSLEYINWLTLFTDDKESFCDNDWLYFPEGIKKSDQVNVDKLCLFYDAIDSYATKNYISPIPCDFGNYYKVRNGNIGFEIGIMVGQGVIFFCQRIPVEYEDEFINVEDLMAGKKQDNVETYNRLINELSLKIDFIYDQGVPVDFIIETLENKTRELKGKTRVLKK